MRPDPGSHCYWETSWETGSVQVALQSPLHGPLTPAEHTAHTTLRQAVSPHSTKARLAPGAGDSRPPSRPAGPGTTRPQGSAPPAGLRPPSRPSRARAWLPLGVVGRVLRCLLQQRHVAQHAGEDEEHGEGVRAPGTKHTAAQASGRHAPPTQKTDPGLGETPHSGEEHSAHRALRLGLPSEDGWSRGAAARGGQL